jgi:hypothetical protein
MIKDARKSIKWVGRFEFSERKNGRKDGKTYERYKFYTELFFTASLNRKADSEKRNNRLSELRFGLHLFL